MEAEIEYLKSELEAAKIREATNYKLYESLLKTLENENAQSINVSKRQDMSVLEIKTLQENYAKEINELKLAHNSVVRSLHDAIGRLKEQVKDLEFERKSEKVGFQQQILDLQTEIFNMRGESAQMQKLIKNNEDKR
jgi:hypothetical protein